MARPTSRNKWADTSTPDWLDKGGTFASPSSRKKEPTPEQLNASADAGYKQVQQSQAKRQEMIDAMPKGGGSWNGVKKTPSFDAATGRPPPRRR